MEIDTLEQSLQQLCQDAVAQLKEAKSLDQAVQVKNRFLGRKGAMQEVMAVLRDLPNDQKRRAGQASNHAKDAIEAAFNHQVEALKAHELQVRLEAERVDVTLPATPAPALAPHPLVQTEQELIDLFVAMGFEVADGPEIEEDFYNFEALNFPHDHPARDMQDTFMFKDGHLLRTHTSPVQVRTLMAYAPPVAVISPGRVYRVDNDPTHSPVFHQVEGLLIDTHISFAHLKGTLEHFVEKCFGKDTPVRFRPSFFPFTEPSAEVDIGCIFCAQDGCKVCSHTGWLEILGCGMVDPNVLAHAGIDAEVYSGFAFGMGVERIAMLKMQVNDIRHFFENDLRFLSQFA